MKRTTKKSVGQLELPIVVPRTISTVHDPYWDSIVLEQTTDSDDVAPEQNTLVLEQVKQGTQPVAPEQLPIHWVETYHPSKRRNQYYRYCYMEGRKIVHVHIPGGVGKPMALERQRLVLDAIASGLLPSEIKQLIKQGG